MPSTGVALLGGLAAIFIWYALNRTAPDNVNVKEGNMLYKEYDYIVIGSGSAGSVVAARLAEDKDNTVLLLEAGGHYNENENIHIPIMWPSLQKTKHDWQYYTEPQTESFQGLNDKKAFVPRGKVLGGTSCFNAMQFTRGSPFDFDEWEAAGCEGWGYKDVLPYFLKMEDINIDEYASSPYHSKGGPISNTLSYQTGLVEYYLRAGEELGYEITDYNGKDQHGFSRGQKIIRNGVRSSTGLEYIGNMGFKENLHVSLNSHVTKIDISEDKRATGVYYIRDGRKMYVKSKKEIIVSAGAINSPQLLMLSGIGPKEHLNELGIEVKADLPVGQNFQDHQLVFLKSRITKPISIMPATLNSFLNKMKYKYLGDGPYTTNSLEGSAFLHLDEAKLGKTYPDIQMIFFSNLFRDNIINMQEHIIDDYFESDETAEGITTAVCLTRPKSVGSITLRSKDPFDHPKIDSAYFTHKEDVDTMIGGIRIWEKLTNTKSWKELGVNIEDVNFKFCSDYTFRSDEYWKCVIKTVSTHEYHHSGTCRMGKRGNPTAVVDPQLKVIGIQGLRVADASIFPNVTSGNINIPTIMVGEKAADMIKREHKLNLSKK